MKKTKKPVLVLQIKINGVIYDRAYGKIDIKNFVQLYNEIHQPQMKLKLVEVKEEK